MMRCWCLRNRKQSGATLFEFTLVFIPALFLFIAALDSGVYLVEMSLIRKAHYAAARKGAVQVSDCTTTATQEMTSSLVAVGIHHSPDTTGSGTASIDGVRGFDFEVSVPTHCVSCIVFPGLHGVFRYQSGTFYPYENQNACTS